VSQVAWQRCYRQFTSAEFRAAAVLHDRAYEYLLALREGDDRAKEYFQAGYVNALYYRAEQTVGDLKTMEDAKARVLLAKQAWRNATPARLPPRLVRLCGHCPD
jgi:hypothetical protein